MLVVPNHSGDNGGMLLPPPPQPPRQEIPSSRLFEERISWIDRCARWVWVANFSFLPLLFLFGGSAYVSLIQQTVGLFLAATCLSIESFRWWKTPRARSGWGWAALLAVPVAILLSGFFAPHAFSSFFGDQGQMTTAGLTWLIGAMVGAAAFLRGEDAWVEEALPLALWGTSALLLIQAVHPVGSIQNTVLAGVVACSFAFGWLWHESRKGSFGEGGFRELFSWLGLALLWVLTTTYLWLLDDASVWFVVLTAVFCLNVFGWRAWKERSRPFLRGASVLWGVLAVVGLLFSLPQPIQIEKGARLSPQITIGVAREALRAHSFFGVGSAGWTTWFDQIRPAGFNKGALTGATFDYGFSTLTTAPAIFGMVGSVLSLAGILLLFMLVLRNWWADPENAPLSWMVVFGVFFAGACVFSWQPLELMEFFLAAGFLLSFSVDFEDIRLSILQRRIFIGGIGVLLIGVGVLLGLQTVRCYAEMQTSLAREQMQSGAFARALESIQRAEKGIPWQHRFVDEENRIRLEWIQRENAPEQITPLIERARFETERWPESAQSWAMLAAAYQVVMGTVDGADTFAIRAWQEAIARRPTDPMYPRELAAIFSQKASKVAVLRSSKEQKVRQGAEQTMREQYRLAQQWLERARQLQSDNPEIIYEMAVVLAKQGDMANALVAMKSVYQALPENPGIALEYALILQANQKAGEAIALLEKTIQRQPDFVKARIFLADLYEAQKRPQDALRLLKGLTLTQQAEPAMQAQIKRLESAQGRVRLMPATRSGEATSTTP